MVMRASARERACLIFRGAHTRDLLYSLTEAFIVSRVATRSRYRSVGRGLPKYMSMMHYQCTYQLLWRKKCGKKRRE